MFAFVSVAGVYLIYRALPPGETGPESELSADIEKDSVSVALQATPGVVVFFFGIAGLLGLLWKVPVKVGEVLPRASRLVVVQACPMIHP